MQRRRFDIPGPTAVLFALLPLLPLSTSACHSGAILMSEHVAPTEREPREGVSYYLPKKVVTVTVWQYETDILDPPQIAELREPDVPTPVGSAPSHHPARYVPVPDVRGLTVGEARRALAAEGLEVGDIERVRMSPGDLHESYESKLIVEQTPLPSEGEKPSWLAQGASVVVRVSGSARLASAATTAPLVANRAAPQPAARPGRGVEYHRTRATPSPRLGMYRSGPIEEGAAPVRSNTSTEVPTVIRRFATFDGEEIIPDLRHQFVVIPQWDIASDDEVTVELTKDGLLSSVTGRAKDQRGEIVSKLAELASLLIRGPLPAPSAMRGVGTRAQPQIVARYRFDPVDPHDRARVQAALARYGISLSVNKQSDCPTANSGAECCTTCTSTNPGIYYRLPIPYRLSLDPGGVIRKPPGTMGEGRPEPLAGSLDRTVLLPNEALCLYVPVDRKMFVTSETSMAFDSGMLRSVTMSKPSELLGFVKIPLDVAGQILAVPTELLTIRIEQKKQEAELAQLESEINKGKTEALTAELELLEAMQRYQKAKAGEGGNDGE